MKYELELYPNKRMLKRVMLISGVMFAFGILLIVIANIFWDEYVTLEPNWKGRMKDSGWPVWAELAGFWASVIGLGMFLLFYFQQDRKNPALALNRQGVMMNQLGWKHAFFEWSEITSLEEMNGENKFGVIVHLRSMKDALAKQDKKVQAYLRNEHVAKKKPVTITNEYVNGDAGIFISQLKKYYSQNKNTGQ